MSDSHQNSAEWLDEVAELFDEEAGLTRNQFLIWLGQEVAPEKPVFNELSVFVLSGHVDVRRFHRAFAQMLAVSDALRTTIQTVDGRPRAQTHDDVSFESDVLDFSGHSDAEAGLETWALAHVDSALDLTVRPYASTLIKLADDRYAWALLVHQILTDATSVGLMYQRVSDAYARSAPDAVEKATPALSFADYVARQIEASRTTGFQNRAAHWASRVSDPADPVVYYGGRSSAARVSGHRERIDHPLGAELTAQVRRFAESDGVRLLSEHLSSFSVFCTALVAYLHKLSGNDRVTVGAPWQNRQKVFRETIGLFMEQNPFEVRIEPDETFRTLLKKVQAEALTTLRHLPYAAGNPGGRVYDVTLNYIKTTFDTFAGIPIEHRWYRPTVGEGSIQLQVHDVTDRHDVTLSFDLSSEVFTADGRDRVIAHYVACLTAMLTDPDQPLGSLTLLTEDEQERLVRWNDTRRDNPRELTVVDLVEAQAARRPDAVAAGFGSERLTYAQLRDRVHDLTARLRSAGVGPGVIVGVHLHRSLDVLIGVLAVLRAGGAYVPLDPTFPRDRLEYMLDDSGAAVVLTHAALTGSIRASRCAVVEIDRPAADPVSAAAANGPAARPEDLAYLLYTSGSTGRPKGVAVSHRALANFLHAMAERPGCSADDVLLAVTTLSFDIAGLELYLPLIVGGRVHIASREEAADARRLRARLDSGEITILQATPATWRMLLDAGWVGTPGLRALVGGEPLPPDLVPSLLDRTDALWNMYGPTETTIWSSVQQITSAHDEITVGRPIANTGFHIVDATSQPVPIGIAGELLISGDGLAEGYHGRPELTAERFVQVAPAHDARPVRMYRTGDLARFDDDGRVIHLGRLDNQVKIRGYRIELGEVERALAEHELVRQAVVTAHEAGSAAACLVAYIVPSVLGTPSASQVREHLRRTLSDYMVPQFFIVLPELPVTLNGKVDRLRLPTPEIDRVSPDAVPVSAMEARVAAAFGAVLGRQDVGADADFFDLGGQSILALRLVSALSEQLGIEVPLQLLFDASTVRALSRKLEVLTATDPDTVGDDLEQRVRGVWRAAIGDEPPDADPLATPLNDAQVIELLTRLRAEFGVPAEGLSVVRFRADPTVGALTCDLRDALDPPQDLVVTLQPNGHEEPLFLIHAGAGYVFFYRAFAARLGTDRPVYAIRAATHRDTGRRRFDHEVSVEALAASYIAEIKAIQPHGPYHLGGACFGGVVAFEMAQQLRRAGDVVGSPVLLFDAFIGKIDEGWRDYAVRALRSAAERIGADPSVSATELMRVLATRAVTRPGDVLPLVPLTARSLYRRARAKLRRLQVPAELSEPAPPDVTGGIDHEQLRTMREFLDASLRLVSAYEPQPYPGSAVLLKANGGLDPEPLWRPWVADGLEVHLSPGSHLDMMEEPWVEHTAKIVRDALARGAAPPASTVLAGYAPGALQESDSM